jgi:hypothetical protein
MKRKLLDELYRIMFYCEDGIKRYSQKDLLEEDVREYGTAKAIYLDRKNDIDRLINLVIKN